MTVRRTADADFLVVENSLLEERTRGLLERDLLRARLATRRAFRFRLGGKDDARGRDALHHLGTGAREERNRMLGRREVDPTGGEERAQESDDPLVRSVTQR